MRGKPPLIEIRNFALLSQAMVVAYLPLSSTCSSGNSFTTGLPPSNRHSWIILFSPKPAARGFHAFGVAHRGGHHRGSCGHAVAGVGPFQSPGASHLLHE